MVIRLLESKCVSTVFLPSLFGVVPLEHCPLLTDRHMASTVFDTSNFG